MEKLLARPAPVNGVDFENVDLTVLCMLIVLVAAGIAVVWIMSKINGGGGD
jgi:hypothetical protein